MNRNRPQGRMAGTVPSPGDRRVAFPVLLATALAVSTFAIPGLSVLSGFLLEDLGISRSQLGWLISLAAASTALLSTAGGRLTDRLGGRLMLQGVFATTLLTMAIMAGPPAYWVLIVAVLVSGFPNAAANPATNKLIAIHAPPGRRGLLIGIKQSGVQAGIFLTGATLPGLALWLGWRGAVAVAVLGPVAGLVATHLLLPPDRPTPGAAQPTNPYRHAGPVRWLAVYSLLMGAGGAAVMSFLPLYAHERLGYTLPVAGAAASLLGLIGVAARIGWAQHVERSGRHRLALVLIALMAMGAAGLLLAAELLGAVLVWVAVVLGGVSIAAWNAVAHFTAVALSEQAHAGRATGLLMLGFMTGFTIAPVAVGWSVDVSGSYRPAWMVVIVLFAAATALMVAWRRMDRAKGEQR